MSLYRFLRNSMLFVLAMGVFCMSGTGEVKAMEEIPEPSPEWVTKLPTARYADQLVVVAGLGKTTAWISFHEKDQQGQWVQLMTTPGFIGKEGLGKTKEGDAKTPVGSFRFTKAFGIAEDPGSVIPYLKVTEDLYWSGDVRPGRNYNEMVSIHDLPDLDTESSEHLIDYTVPYQYCLNIGYNTEGTPGLGSALFLHCLGAKKPWTGGCVAIPEDKMRFVLQHAQPDCFIVIDSLENLGGSI